MKVGMRAKGGNSFQYCGGVMVDGGKEKGERACGCWIGRVLIVSKALPHRG